jgi:hypothetical protein
LDCAKRGQRQTSTSSPFDKLRERRKKLLMLSLSKHELVEG